MTFARIVKMHDTKKRFMASNLYQFFISFFAFNAFALEIVWLIYILNAISIVVSSKIQIVKRKIAPFQKHAQDDIGSGWMLE